MLLALPHVCWVIFCQRLREKGTGFLLSNGFVPVLLVSKVDSKSLSDSITTFKLFIRSLFCLRFSILEY